jgi:type IV secretion system protein TrbE
LLTEAKSVAEYVPWEEEILPGIVCTKDLDLVLLYEYLGTDVDGVMPEEVDAMASQLEKALALVDETVAIWTGAFRRRTTDYPLGRFQDEFAASLDAAWREEMSAGTQYVNLHLIAFTLSGRRSRGSILKATSEQIAQGRGLLRAMGTALSTAFSESRLEAAFAADFHRDADRLQDVASSVLGAVPRLRPARLEGEKLRSVLKLIVNPASQPQPVRSARLDTLLDAYLPDNSVRLEGRQIAFTGTNAERRAAIISIKDWPETTRPGLIDGLLALPIELTVAQTFKGLRQGAAQRYIETTRRYNQQRRLGLKDVALAKLTDSPLAEEDEDHGRSHNVREANEALLAMRSERRVYGYYNLTLVVYGDCAPECEEAARLAVDLVQSQGYVCIREGVGMLSAFKATLPGRHEDVVRWHFANTGHAADLAFTRTIDTGHGQSSYLSEQLGRSCPALMLLPTEHSTPYWYDLMHGQVGHTLIIGPTGGGKTVLTNFMAMQFARYGEVNIIRLDKDYSCFIPTVLSNGTHIDLTSGDVMLNPWRLVRQPQHRAWLARFAKTLMVSHGYSWSSDDDVTVKRALDSLAHLPDAEIHMEGFADSVGSEALRRELAPWLPGGTLGHLFSSAADNFEVSNNCCIEMGNLLVDPIASPRLIDYLTYRIRMLLDQQTVKPTLIDIQEAWAFLADPLFRREIDNWLKTLRKKLASVVLSTQSLQDAASSEVFGSIGDNVPTRIFLPNTQARGEKWRRLYSEALGMNDAQISRIAEAVPYRDFYLVRGGFSRMLMFRLPAHILAGLRSDKRALSLIRSRIPADPVARQAWDWKQAFVEELIDGA